MHTHTYCSRGPKANSYSISVLDRNRPMSQPTCVCVCVQRFLCVWGGEVRVHVCIWIQITTKSQCHSDASSAFFSQSSRNVGFHSNQLVVTFTSVRSERSVAAAEICSLLHRQSLWMSFNFFCLNFGCSLSGSQPKLISIQSVSIVNSWLTSCWMSCQVYTAGCSSSSTILNKTWCTKTGSKLKG